MEILRDEIDIKPYTIAEMALIYRTPLRTFRKWLEPHNITIGKRIGHFYNVKQVEVIFAKLGYPGKIVE
jgi:hypothetical protein